MLTSGLTLTSACRDRGYRPRNPRAVRCGNPNIQITRHVPRHVGPYDAREYWNGAASQKEFTIPLAPAFLASRVPPSARVLDVGCGYGRLLGELQGLGYTALTGIDLSPAMIARARSRHPGIAFVVVDHPPYPFSPDSFDLVLLFAVLTCIPETAAQETLVEEIHRLLAPGGYLYACDFLLNNDDRNRARYDRYAPEFGTRGIFRIPGGGVVRHHAPEHVAALLQAFEGIKYREEIFTTMNGHAARGVRVLVQNGPGE